jgi:hypothetical protein
MGLFDNIIGTASEDIEPLGMEAITDDTKQESTSGTGGSGTGTGGTGTGGTGTGGTGTGNNIDTMINIGDLSSPNTPNIATNSWTDDIPNIDIGWDMDFSSLWVSFDQPIEQTEAVATITETIEIPKIENNTENTTTTTIIENNTPSLIIDTGIDLSESNVIEEDSTTVESTIVGTTESNPTFSLLDNNIADITPIVSIPETIVETPTENTSLVDIVSEDIKEGTPTNSISEITPVIETTTSGTSPLSSLNLGYQKNNQENSNHEPLSVRIGAFLKELEELKSNDEVTRAKLEQELVQIREDEKKINDAINLLNNIKNI